MGKVSAACIITDEHLNNSLIDPVKKAIDEGVKQFEYFLSLQYEK